MLTTPRSIARFTWSIREYHVRAASSLVATAVLVLALLPVCAVSQSLRVNWKDEILSIQGPHLPGGRIDVWYIEAFCRAGSTGRDWNETLIPHTTKVIQAAADGRRITLRSSLIDGVRIDHEITASDDVIDFQVSAHNPTDKISEMCWAQPCIRVDRFTGCEQHNYLNKCFIYLDGKLARLPLEQWSTKARYVPGQVWRPDYVDQNDVNPRPLSTIVLTQGLIGCYSADESLMLATAWDPFQELFQGVITCLHSDFRIAGLQPGETKNARGKIYIVSADESKLIRRFVKDFPDRVADSPNSQD